MAQNRADTAGKVENRGGLGTMAQAGKGRSVSRKPVGGTAPRKAVKRVVKAAIKAGAAAKKVVKTSTGNRGPTKPTTPRRATATNPARRTAPQPAQQAPPGRRLTARPAPQRFTASHLNEADFKPDGLRPYALYRDLGIAAATGGLCQAHVIRLVPPCTEEVRKRHTHDTELQLVYVLKGWVKNEFEGQGEQMMSQGSCWIQPPGIPHTVLDYSADAELLEIVIPADFKTAEL
jgi:uncharacterized RmlC-like cupin family protein